MSFHRDGDAAALLHAIVEGSPDAIFVKDLEGRYILCNEAGARAVGRSVAQVVGRTDSEIVSPEQARAFAADDRRVLERNACETNEDRLVVDGETRTMLTMKFPYRKPDGTVGGVVGVSRDITDRVNLLERVRQSESLLRLVLDAMPVGVLLVDGNGDIVLGNRTSERIWGKSIVRGADRWKRSRAWWHASGEPVQAHEWASVRALFEGVPQLDQLVDIESFDGTRRTIRNSAVPIRQPRFNGAVIVNEDVTERVRLEDGLEQTRKIEAIGQLAGSVAHDFNNLLTIIMSYVDVLGSSLASDDSRRDDLREVQRAAESAAALTRQLLAFGRRDAVQPRIVSLESTVAGVEKLLARLIGEHVRIRARYAEPASFVRIDPFQIEQIVLNLAVNARDAMPDGGELVLETHVVDVPDVGRVARLEVRDTGTGMDAATRARIFEPFYTTKDRGRGTGLGLATVAAIVKQNGGTIAVTSEPGQGTTFAIDLPVAAATDAEVAGAEKPDAVALRGTERILLVEDSAPVRVAVRAILERLGYAVTDVGDAAAALATVGDGKAPVGLVLIDVVLPTLGGPELAAAILAIRPEIRVLFMSAYSDDELPKRDRPASTSPVVAKPFTAEVLARAVRDALDGRAHA